MNYLFVPKPCFSYRWGTRSEHQSSHKQFDRRWDIHRSNRSCWSRSSAQRRNRDISLRFPPPMLELGHRRPRFSRTASDPEDPSPSPNRAPNSPASADPSGSRIRRRCAKRRGGTCGVSTARFWRAQVGRWGNGGQRKAATCPPENRSRRSTGRRGRRRGVSGGRIAGGSRALRRATRGRRRPWPWRWRRVQFRQCGFRAARAGNLFCEWWLCPCLESVWGKKQSGEEKILSAWKILQRVFGVWSALSSLWVELFPLRGFVREENEKKC